MKSFLCLAMEWTKNNTTRLIEQYREKRVLWDPTVMEFKDRNKKHDAWAELGAGMNTDAMEVEKKMRALIGQFQRESRKGKSGDGTDSKPKWIFFNMLLFMKDKNQPRHFTEAGLLNETSHEDIAQSKDKNETIFIEVNTI